MKGKSIQSKLIDACISFIKNGTGKETVRQMFYDYTEEMRCNHGTWETIVSHREIVAQRVVINCIYALTWEEQEQLQCKLYEFAKENITDVSININR